jgi:hypothetical protein
MRQIFLIALAGMILAPLSLAAQADESTLDKPSTSVKRNYVPNPKMMVRVPGVSSVPPGAESPESQRTDSTGAGGEPRNNTAAHAAASTLTEGRDSPAAAAAATATDASRMSASAAAETATARDR